MRAGTSLVLSAVARFSGWVVVDQTDWANAVRRFHDPPCRCVARQTLLLGEFALGGVESRSWLIFTPVLLALWAKFPRAPLGTAVDARVGLVNGQFRVADVI